MAIDRHTATMEEVVAGFQAKVSSTAKEHRF